MSNAPKRSLATVDGDAIAVDEASTQLVLIDSLHHRIHQGQLFTAAFLSSSLPDTNSIQVLIRVVAGQPAHLRATFAAGGNAIGHFYTGPTTSADGAGLTRQNRNLVSSLTANTLVFSGPTVSDPGTELPQTLIPGGSKNFASGSAEDFFSELVLPPGDYLAELENISGGAVPAAIQLDWYEPLNS